MERALGAQWNVEHDTFTFSMAVKQQPTTRHGILSIVNSVYDPQGLVAPIILTGKRILQELCKIKLGWDEEVPEIIAQQWQQWVAELQQLDDFRVDRCLTSSNFSPILAECRRQSYSLSERTRVLVRQYNCLEVHCEHHQKISDICGEPSFHHSGHVHSVTVETHQLKPQPNPSMRMMHHAA